MTNIARYAIMNEDTAIAIVYERESFGRTMVVLDKINLNFPIKIWDLVKNEFYGEPKFLDFILEMLPKE